MSSIGPLSSSMAKLDIDEKKESPYQTRCFHTIRNAHFDDIHGAIRLADRTFITGSKDGALKKWSFDGKLVKDVFKPPYINYESWITALSPLGKDHWVSGTRDGLVHRRNLKGDLCPQIQAAPAPASTAKCKERNFNRVNCLADYSQFSPQLQFIAGWPKQFTLHPQSLGFARASDCLTSQNDWVYSVYPLAPRTFLTVTGCRLDIYTHPEGNLKKWEQTILIEEKFNPVQRPYISAITPLQGKKDNFGLSIFDGSISIYDLQAQKIVMKGQEHRGRVWTIENITEGCFASCADDGLIKLWDLRQSAKSIETLKGPDRVSVLLRTEENVFVSGSCPKDLVRAKEWARLSFWDRRKI